MAQDKDQKTLNVPPLRFPGFTDEWKKTTLGEIGETMIGLTYSPKDVVENGGTIVFRSSNIQNGMIDYSDLVRVTKPIKERIITKEKDILICARNGSQRLIGKNTLLRESDAGNTFGAFMMVYRSDDNDIIHPLLSTKQYVSQVAENLGARINQITTSDLNSFEFFLPQESEEKRKIGELFALINERIATQNKIIEDLKKLKSAIIDRLYSEVKGETCTYSELFTVVTERNSKRTYNKVIAASQEYGMVERESLNLKVQFDEELINTYKIINSGDYVIHLRSFQGGFAFSKLQGICSPAYIILRPNDRVEFSYFENYFTSSKFINSLRLVTYGIRDGRSINVEEWLSMKVTLPSKEEQKRIIRTIQSIQDKVSNEIRILTSLHRQRLFLLRELFI